MALAYNNSVIGSHSGGSWSVSVSIASGHDVIVGVVIDGSSITVQSITDSASNAYTLKKAAPYSGAGFDVEIWVAHNISAITSVSITLTGTPSNAPSSYVIGDYSGVNTY